MGFGLRLATFRKERKIGQGELARAIGVHPNVLGRYEREEAMPSIEVATKLAEASGISLDYLVGKTDMQLDKSLIDKIMIIQKLPEEDRVHIMYSLTGLIQHAKNRMAYEV
ncbi:MAG: helix-turn-helix transcriptional regulator [Cyclobacteriaceae bacterium]|nr:helix-turn-helix transcriptional regulator [Cyclobacteriaceae bacterium]